MAATDGTVKVLHGGRVRKEIAERAYEVYGKFHHQSFETLYQRGGFAASELIALLYARTFPENEWGARMSEAYDKMNIP